MIRKVITIISIASLCLLTIMVNVANPTEIGPFGILIFFAFFYTSLLGIMAYLIYIANRLYAMAIRIFMAKKPVPRLDFKRSSYYSSVISMGVVIIIGLQTVSAAGVYQLLLVVILVVVGCIYVSKRIS